MSKSFSLSMILAVAALGLTVPLSAQTRSAVTVAELDAAIAERPAAVGEAVQQFLTTDQGQEVADRMGMSVSQLSARVADLDETSLDRIAELAGVSEEVLAGGADTIVISVTTVIIILLLVILLTK